MDPLSALGLASAIAQFIDIGIRVAERLSEYNSVNLGDAPKSLQAICIQLPLLVNALNRMKTEAAMESIDFNTRCILRGVIMGCMAQVDDVEGILNEITLQPGDNLKVRLRKVFVSLKRDEKVWEIERNLHTYISVLILHHVVDDSDAPQPPGDDDYFDVREQQVSPLTPRLGLLKKLDSFFYDASRSLVTQPTIVFLIGEKGSGKTQLALRYCHQSRSLGQFRSVFWLDATTPETLSLSLESVSAVILRTTRGSREEKISHVKKVLGDLWHPWLLVLENHDPSSFRQTSIMDFLPTSGYGAIIIIVGIEHFITWPNIIDVPKFVTAEEQRRLDGSIAKAIQARDFVSVKNSLNDGADPNALIWDEWPCLVRAALFGEEETVQLLLSKGADVNARAKGATAAYWAGGNGHAKIVDILLDQQEANGFTPNLDDDNLLFNEAVREGHSEVVTRFLKRRNVTMNAKNKYGETPLQACAGKGHAAIVKLLIEHGALKEDASQANQALMDAASHGHLETMKILCSEAKANPNYQNAKGETPLFHAVKAGDHNEAGAQLRENMTRFLLDLGADPNLVAKDGGPLINAGCHDNVDIIRLLLKHGANPLQADGFGYTALTTAMRYGSEAAFNHLLGVVIVDEKGRDDYLETALKFAARTGKRDMVLKVLKAGVKNIDTVDSNGSTPLMLATKCGHVQIARLLVKHGARQDIPDQDGQLPLPLAAESGYDLLVRELIRAGKNPNQKNAKGETPLCLAAAEGHLDTVRQLLNNGADQEIANDYGDTPLDIAEEKHFTKVVELLEGLEKL